MFVNVYILKSYKHEEVFFNDIHDTFSMNLSIILEW